MNSERSNQIELASAIILSLAALLSAWCGFENSRWGSVQNKRLGEANLKSSEAMEKMLDFNQRFAFDGTLILNFVNATIEGKRDLVDFYVKHSRPEISQLMVKWLESKPLENPAAYPQPLEQPEYTEKVKNERAKAETLRKESEASRAAALYADKIGNQYLMLTVLFSIVLFLCGIESKFHVVRLRLMMLTLSGLLLLFAIYRLAQLQLAGG